MSLRSTLQATSSARAVALTAILVASLAPAPARAALPADATDSPIVSLEVTTGLLTLVAEVSGGTALPTAWTLNANPEFSGVSGVSQEVEPGTITLSFDAGGPANYDAGVWRCDGGTFTQDPEFPTVEIVAGDVVTCTVTFTYQPPTYLTLVKQVVNDGGGSASAGDWILTATSGFDAISGTTGDAAVQHQQVAPGTWELSEAGEAGDPPFYRADDWTCGAAVVSGDAQQGFRVELTAGDDVTCTVVNRYEPPARLTLVKMVDNTDGGTAEATAWTLVAYDSGYGTAVEGTTGVTALVEPGDYTLSESWAALSVLDAQAGPDKWYEAGDWSCGDATVGIVDGMSVVTLESGDDVTCTIVNTYLPPATLSLAKRVDRTLGGTAEATAWTVGADGSDQVSGAGSVEKAVVPSGTYTLLEQPAEDWTLDVWYAFAGWECSGGTAVAGGGSTTVEVTSGATVACTVTNRYRGAATVTLRSEIEDATGGTLETTAWTLSLSGPLEADASPGTAVLVPAGTYALGEAPSESADPDAFEAYWSGDWRCTGATVEVDWWLTPRIELTAGATVECTIVHLHRRAATMTLRATVSGGGSATAGDVALSADGPVVLWGAMGDPEVTGRRTRIGIYELGWSLENAARYVSDGWVCTGALAGHIGSTPSVDATAGASVECTVALRYREPGVLTLAARSVGVTGPTVDATAWTLYADGPDGFDGITGTPDVSTRTVAAGSYRLIAWGERLGELPGTWACTGATATGTGGGIATVEVSSNSRISCLLTVQRVGTGSLTLSARVENSGGGTAEATAWTLTAWGPTPIDGIAGDPAVTARAVTPGSYGLGTDAGPAQGYRIEDWDCTGGTLIGEGAWGEVEVTAGGSVACEVAIRWIGTGRLTLVAAPEGADPPDASAFTLAAYGRDDISGEGGSPSVTGRTLTTGRYSLYAFDAPLGYAPVAWRCGTGPLQEDPVGAIELTSGANVTCTVTEASVGTGRITLANSVVNLGRGTAAASHWRLGAYGPVSIRGRTGSRDVTARPVTAGSYSLDGGAMRRGYRPSAWACTGTSLGADATIEVTSGATIACARTRTWVGIGRLTLVAELSAGVGPAVKATDWYLDASGPDSAGGASGEPETTRQLLTAGEYALDSQGPAGYAGVWRCTGGALSASPTGPKVQLNAGADVTCTVRQAVGWRLTVFRGGAGDGTVSSSPVGIQCGSGCAYDYVAGTLVTLTATAAPGSSFTGWSGSCTGSGRTCTLTISAARTTTATFVPAVPRFVTQPASKVVKSGTAVTFSLSTGDPADLVRWQRSRDGMTWMAVVDASR